MQQSEVDSGGFTVAGQRRGPNQDAWTIFSLDRSSGWVVCAVADGVGGSLAGEIASASALGTTEAALRAWQLDDPSGAVRKAIAAANTAIWNEARRDSTKEGMASTIVCALVGPVSAVVANVGDSRAMLISPDDARQITRDHSLVAELVSRGDVKPEAAAGHPLGNILSRSLGRDAEVEVEIYPPVSLNVADALVLCSDGLSRHVPLDEIATIVRAARSAVSAARALVELADTRSSQENITAVVVRRQPSREQ